MFDLNQKQAAAIEQIVAWRENRIGPRFLSLTGPAGSGKTATLRVLKERLGKNTVWAAMTGKAASRMKEAAGVKSKTLHAALYMRPREIDNDVRQRVDLLFEDVRQTKPSLLIIDESSMISRKVFKDIGKSCYDKVLFVGDDFQISPVDDNDSDYSVFRDVKGPRLDTVMRAGGAILKAATWIREKQEILSESVEEDGTKYEFVYAHNENEAFRRTLTNWFEHRDDHVIITFRNAIRMQVNRAIRGILEHTDTLPQVGEPIVIRKNVHEADLMNGDVVIVEEWLEKGLILDLGDKKIETRYVNVRLSGSEEIKTILVLLCGGNEGIFDGNTPYVGYEKWNRALMKGKQEAITNGDGERFNPVPISYGYCVTLHAAQGSEFRHVTTYLPGDFRINNFTKMTKLPNGDSVQFSMRFAYTAVSRSQKSSTLIISTE